MKQIKKILTVKFFLLFSFIFQNISQADNHNLYEILEKIQNDIQTLEKAVYLGSIGMANETR